MFKKICFLIFLFASLALFASHSLAITREECERKLNNEEELSLEELEECETILSNLLQETKKQEKSLKSEISRFNREITLTNTRVNQIKEQIRILGEEIESLGKKIYHLDLSLNEISALLIERIEKTYKIGRTDSFFLLLSSENFSQFMTRLKYFRAVQLHDKKLLFQIQRAKSNYQEQKDIKKEKQEEQELAKKKLDYQKMVLGKQKQDRENFLAVTKNNKERYDQLLEEARREVQAILTSRFTDKKHISRNEIIGLMGNTGFSFGAHLHFGVYNLREEDSSQFDYFSNVENPFSYLENRTFLFEATSCDDVPQDQSKAIGSGSWSWPMSNPRITQCFGHTPWSLWYSGDFHHGVDMADSNNIEVRAVEEGEAYFYKGETSFGNNVRVFHPNGKMTLYLHLR